MASHDQTSKVVDPVKPETVEKPGMMETIKLKTQEVKDKIFKKPEGSKDDTTTDLVVEPDVIKEKAYETTEAPHEEPTEAGHPKYGGTLDTTPSQVKKVSEAAAEVAQETLHVGEIRPDGTEKYGTTSIADKE